MKLTREESKSKHHHLPTLAGEPSIRHPFAMFRFVVFLSALSKSRTKTIRRRDLDHDEHSNFLIPVSGCGISEACREELRVKGKVWVHAFNLEVPSWGCLRIRTGLLLEVKGALQGLSCIGVSCRVP